MTVVVDASIAVAFLLREPGCEALEALLERARSSDVRMVVPLLFWHEVQNVLLMAKRRARPLPATMDRLLGWLDDLPFDTEMEMTGRIRTRIMELADRHGLTVYDAVYLELALRVKAKALLTLDGDLLALRPDHALIADRF